MIGLFRISYTKNDASFSVRLLQGDGLISDSDWSQCLGKGGHQPGPLHADDASDATGRVFLHGQCAQQIGVLSLRSLGAIVSFRSFILWSDEVTLASVRLFLS